VAAKAAQYMAAGHRRRLASVSDDLRAILRPRDVKSIRSDVACRRMQQGHPPGGDLDRLATTTPLSFLFGPNRTTVYNTGRAASFADLSYCWNGARAWSTAPIRPLRPDEPDGARHPRPAGGVDYPRRSGGGPD